MLEILGEAASSLGPFTLRVIASVPLEWPSRNSPQSQEENAMQPLEPIRVHSGDRLFASPRPTARPGGLPQSDLPNGQEVKVCQAQWQPGQKGGPQDCI